MFDFFVMAPLPFAMLLIILIDRVWKNHDFQFTYRLVRILLLINWGIFLLSMALNYSEFWSFVNRATGPYWWAYSTMILSAFISPIFLFHKKWSKNKWALFLIAFLSTIGQSFEVFVIVITSLHQDYLPSGFDTFSYWRLLIRPLILAGVFLLIEFLLIHNRINEKSLTEDIIDSDDL